MNRLRPLAGIALLLLAACERAPDEQALRYSATPPTESRPVYRLAIHPLHNPKKLAEAYQPLITYLDRVIPEVRIELEASRDYQSYETKFRARAPQLLLPNPWQTLEAMKSGYHVIAMAGDAEDFRGIFIVRRDSAIATPADLKGKTVAYPSPTALAACIMPQYFLHQHGVDVNRDINNVYVGSQESSIMNVYLRQADAGATWPLPWRLFERDHPTEAAQLQVIWQTPSLLNNSLMVRDDTPPAIAHQLQQALLGLTDSQEGQAILDAMSTARFHRADDATYRPVSDYITNFEREVRPVEKR